MGFLFSLTVVVLVLGGFFLPACLRRGRYWWYFRSQGIAFDGGYSPNGGSFYWFVAHVGPKTTGREIVLGGAPTSQSPELTMIDLDDDGVPEIHISGEDPADPGRNFLRYIPATKDFETIPIDQVPPAWKARFQGNQK
jgi:hypothetical protein